jgi:hypothetical protein
MVKRDIINLINKYVEYNGKLKITDRKFLDYVNIDESEIIIDIDKYQYLEEYNLAYSDYGVKKYINIKDKYLLKILNYCNKNIIKSKPVTKEEIIKEINNIIEEYGDFSSYDIDKYLTIDELKCGRVYVVTKNYEVNKVYCEILLCEDVLDEEYYDYNMLDIEVLKEILDYCNIYKQQCIEN